MNTFQTTSSAQPSQQPPGAPKPGDRAAEQDAGRASSRPPSDRELRIAAARRAKVIKRSLVTTAVVLGIAAIVFAAVWYSRRPAGPQPGVFYPEQGREHVALGTPFSYSSNPPTSGPHFANPAEWGVYQEEIQDQILIHNLEHGGIWISYKPGIDSQVLSKLEAIAKDVGRKVIMAPRKANGSDIALVAWTHLDTFSAAEYSEKRVRDFIKAYRNRGPEFVP